MTITDSRLGHLRGGLRGKQNSFQSDTDINNASSNVTKALNSPAGSIWNTRLNGIGHETQIDFKKAIEHNLKSGENDLTANDMNSDSAASLRCKQSNRSRQARHRFQRQKTQCEAAEWLIVSRGSNRGWMTTSGRSVEPRGQGSDLAYPATPEESFLNQPTAGFGRASSIRL